MRTSKIVHVVSCHAEGEVGDVIVGGVTPPPGNTIWEQSRWLAKDETLRNFVLNEPRGGVFRHVNLLVPPKNPKAQMAWIIMEPADNPPMSGSNSICVSTVLLDTGIIPMQEQLGFKHPANDWNHISFCQITDPITKKNGVLWGKNAVVIQPGKIDRSPTGTGCSARMAVLYARGEMKVGDKFVGTSIIDTEFHCRIDSVGEINGKPAINPIISGRAWVTGIHQHMIDPSDPFPTGYRLADTWPMNK